MLFVDNYRHIFVATKANKYTVKMRLSDRIQRDTPYTRIAKQLGVSAKFVGMIARGERKALRGKGLQVKEKLEELINNN
jgi:hypothetical protein